MGRVISKAIFAIIAVAFVYVGWGYLRPAAPEITTAQVERRPYAVPLQLAEGVVDLASCEVHAKSDVR